MRRLACSIVAVVALTALSAGAAHARCPERISVDWGDTLASIAQSCGISVGSLQRVNPGLSASTLQAGSVINVPQAGPSSPPIVFGNPQVEIAPQLVPPGMGITSPRVVSPPLPTYPQHILPGFGGEPGQLPLPPGHYVDIP
jgi:hypothetical protein